MDERIKEWIKKIPKSEIHLHLEAVVKISSYIELNKKYNIDSSLKTVDDYNKQLSFKDLKDMILFFLHLQTFFREEEDYAYMAKDVVDYARENNIRYMEVYFSPSKIIQSGFIDIIAVFNLLDKAFLEIREQHGLDVKILLDVSRSFGPENAMRNLEILLEYLKTRKESCFIGIGLGGAELNNSCLEYKDVFELAQKNHLHTVAHAGEEVGSESIWHAIDGIGAERIGHGTSAMLDEKLMAYLKKNQTPLEICPKSNIITKKYVTAMEEHPIRKFFDMGINVTLNTDDPVLFDIDLNTEYYNLYKKLNFSKEELLKVVKNTLDSTFLSEKEKKRYWMQVEEAVYQVEKDG